MGARWTNRRTKCTKWVRSSGGTAIENIGTIRNFGPNEEDAKTTNKWRSYFVNALSVSDWTWIRIRTY